MKVTLKLLILCAQIIKWEVRDLWTDAIFLEQNRIAGVYHGHRVTKRGAEQ